MATGDLNGVVQYLRRAMTLDEGTGLTDAQLLADYISRRNAAALAALVQRHAPMVWGVCRRVLRSHHDAEDAFQATFLVLARKAASIAAPELLANWLYGVAHQTARKARATVARRKARERQVTEMPEPAVAGQDLWDDLQPLLDQELNCLPDGHRVVIVLCDLEGKTRKEAARQLGLPEGTVASRLARARVLLARRLTRRGVALSGGALAAVLAQNLASAAVPGSVVSSTIRAASLVAAGQAAAAGPVSVKAAALAEGVLRAMMMSKLKAVVAGLLVLGVLVARTAIPSGRTASAQGGQAPAVEVSAPAKPEQEKKGFTAWGEEVGGVQAGLGYLPGQKRAYHPGETAKLVVRVRNVGKKEVKFVYAWESFYEEPPAVTDGAGKPVPFKGVGFSGEIRFVEVNLASGKQIDLCELNLALRPASEKGKDRPWSLYGTGKFHLQFERIGGNIGSGVIKFDPVLRELVTGKLELEVKDEEKQSEKKQAREGFTAWGKEIGGLEAGLGFRPGEKRAYSHGETVKLVLRVRNVGKEEVKFQYLDPFKENSPTVTDGAGKPVPQPPVLDKVLGQRVPVEVKLAPGKEIELHELKRWLRPASESGNEKFYGTWRDGAFFSTFYGTGKVSVQYEGLARPDTDPILSKLATGKLEVGIKPDVLPPKGAKQENQKEGDARAKPIRMRVHIEKVNAESRTIAASCMTIGEFDNVSKPLRFENLSVSEKARIRDNGKEIRLTDLRPGTGVFLELEVSELALMVVGIERIR